MIMILLALFAWRSYLGSYLDETQAASIPKIQPKSLRFDLYDTERVTKQDSSNMSKCVMPAPESSKANTSLRTVYVITPTFRRHSQRPDITRMAQTLISARGVHWIVIEDSKNKSQYVTSLLQRMPFPYTHLQVPTNDSNKHTGLGGIDQRNAALRWLLSNNITQGVIYFADDDNAYDRRLFDEFRTTEKVGMTAVGHFSTAFSTPVVKNGKVVAFLDPYLSRKWPIDMAVFAVSVPFWRSRGAPLMRARTGGLMESHFLSSLNIGFDDIEPKGKNCTEVLAWHVKTVAMTDRYKKFNFTKYRGTNVDSLLLAYD